MLSKTQAHDVLVPWQHEVVSEEEEEKGVQEGVASAKGGRGTEEALIDLEGGENSGDLSSFYFICFACVALISFDVIFFVSVGAKNNLLSCFTLSFTAKLWHAPVVAQHRFV